MQAPPQRHQHRPIVQSIEQWGNWGPAGWVTRRMDGEPWAAYKARAAATGATHAYPVTAHLDHHQPIPATQPPWSGERASLADGLAPIRRWGKTAAGHLLDGREITELPPAAYLTPAGPA